MERKLMETKMNADVIRWAVILSAEQKRVRERKND
jgi:hypothetical protein